MQLLLLAAMLMLGGTVAADSNNFDVLIFTQQWPVTTCIEWKDQNPHHTCLLPSPKEMWTIHGVWPTLLGTIGPSFCNKSATFDPAQLKPFEDQLEQFWMNVERGQQLWKHEWLKHGTCASVLPELADEHLYFGRGLSWLHQYSMSSILGKARILPGGQGQRMRVELVHDAVVKALGRRPFIRCLRDRQSAVTYLSEIRLCFAKNMTLVDCDGVKLTEEQYDDDDGDYDDSVEQPQTMNTNCPDGLVVEYPDVVPPSRLLAAERPVVFEVEEKEDEESKWRFPWVEVYKLLSLIKAATL